MTTTNDIVRCNTCGHSGRRDDLPSWHPFRHPINLDGSVPFGKKPTESPTAMPVPGPFDPVLRMALIDKGIITPDDLRTAEEKIHATTIAVTRQFTLGGNGGQETNSG